MHTIVPPYVLQRVAGSDPALASEARTALWVEHHRRTLARLPRRPRSGSGLTREISDAGGRETTPGRLVRGEGDAATGDAATDEAYEGLGAVYRYFQQVHGRDSLDGAGGPLLATVHYGRGYDNAFFDGARMVFGDGDGRLFLRFTRALDVIGHELMHGILADEADLAYHDQTGALNESVCDVFGTLVKQHARQQSVTEADWLIGDEILGPAVQGVALRSMAAPGTAYDDPMLGKDPQPDHMDRYVQVGEDSGGVHINSGIPNKAFHDAAVASGGYAWETVGPVWYATVLDPELDRNPGFAAFAAVTVRAAASLPDGARIAAAVRAAWDGVGVTVEVASPS
ncbi:M4 family metallopeptidase [Pseudonocardia sp. K10HN5]|uniref:Neutral metalloproteinase n=2 Tax=Pseudonocardia acidicola TaxID=2724939 RepID=A0ABX1S8W4_9PSEU|nr:M4 family metallopeptidase [Pseudonocardia acidicola]